jgi:hypothetical protein
MILKKIILDYWNRIDWWFRNTMFHLKYKDDEGNTYIVFTKQLTYWDIATRIILIALILFGFWYLRHLISVRCIW